jgi:hypothetical protein
VCVNHFLCHKAKTTPGTPKFAPVLDIDLVDQFESLTVAATKPKHLCAPADKAGEGIPDLATHVVGYQVKPVAGSPKHVPRAFLRVTNQLGVITLSTIKPDFLLVPSTKDHVVDPPLPNPSSEIDHYKCYKAKVTPHTPKFPRGITVSVSDQFGTRPLALVKPSHLCTPVDKNGEGTKHPAIHQLCYKAKPAPPTPRAVGLHVNNQLGPLRLDTVKEDLLCVPSLKRLP